MSDDMGGLKIILRKQELRIRQLEFEAGQFRDSLLAMSQSLDELTDRLNDFMEEKSELESEELKESIKAQKLFNEGLGNIMSFTGVANGQAR